jgi:hypothetical protein
MVFSNGSIAVTSRQIDVPPIPESKIPIGCNMLYKNKKIPMKSGF